MTQAHAQDFERKRRPEVPESASPYQAARTAQVESSDDEDEEEEDASVAGAGPGAAAEGDGGGGEETRADEEDVQDVLDAEEILRRRRSATE